MVGKVTEVFRAVICCMLLCFCLNCSTPNIKASPFCKGIFSSVALFLFFFLCLHFSLASGAIRGSASRSVPGLREWTEAGGPGPHGGSAAGPVGAVYPPP